MALDLTPEQKEIGKANAQRVLGQLQTGVTRRDFVKGVLAAGAAVPITAAAYFGYQSEARKLDGGPVRAALIGAGDEGGILVTEHNPKFLEFVAVCDLRPSNKDRIFTGDKPGKGPRKGFEGLPHYGRDARAKIKVFDDYKQLLNDQSLGIEAVVIALPLHLHAPIAMAAMEAGKHVLCEKLMAWNIGQCKQMIKTADDHDHRILVIGHQRHYSMLYGHAVEILKSGMLGDIKHIRALWHRNNTWPIVDERGKEVEGTIRDSWHPDIPAEDRAALETNIRALGYKSMEELCRWRLYKRTGGGLMAELGSHQLDACSIFLSANMIKDQEQSSGSDLRGKVHPLAVSGVGGKFYYHDDREIDDHVFVTFEFPGPNYYADPEHKEIKDKNDVVVVTYSSISTNAFEPYGECVMGTRGTMVVEKEQDLMLYPERGAAGARSTAVGLTTSAAGQPVLDSSATSGAAAPATAAGGAALGAGPVSRGYREEIEHFAYCIRMQQQATSAEEKIKWQRTPHCHGRIAMADAIIALTSNLAMKHQKRIPFLPEWFQADSPAVPDAENVPDPFLKS